MQGSKTWEVEEWVVSKIAGGNWNTYYLREWYPQSSSTLIPSPDTSNNNAVGREKIGARQQGQWVADDDSLSVELSGRLLEGNHVAAWLVI